MQTHLQISSRPRPGWLCAQISATRQCHPLLPTPTTRRSNMAVAAGKRNFGEKLAAELLDVATGRLVVKVGRLLQPGGSSTHVQQRRTRVASLAQRVCHLQQLIASNGFDIHATKLHWVLLSLPGPPTTAVPTPTHALSSITCLFLVAAQQGGLSCASGMDRNQTMCPGTAGSSQQSRSSRRCGGGAYTTHHDV